jgi:hypothetical protein
VAIEPDTGLFTEGRLTQACGQVNHEAVIGLQLLEGEDGELEVLGDSAYGTGDARAALADQGHTAVIKPNSLRPAVADGFTIDEFTVDDHNNTVTCPNGSTPRITPSRTVTFRSRLPRLPAARTMHHQQDRSNPQPAPSPHPAAPRPPRLSRQRPAPLHLPATPPHGGTLYRLADRTERPLPKLRYRGTLHGDLCLHLRMAGLNLRRLLNLGLDRTRSCRHPVVTAADCQRRELRGDTPKLHPGIQRPGR